MHWYIFRPLLRNFLLFTVGFKATGGFYFLITVCDYIIDVKVQMKQEIRTIIELDIDGGKNEMTEDLRSYIL